MSDNVIHIGFLTAAKVSINPLTWVSKAIEKLSGKYTHSFCLYDLDDVLYVRSMEINGVDVSKTYKKYGEEYGERLSLLKLDVIDSTEYNYYCRNEKAKYEFKNLLVWQYVKAKFGVWLGWDTRYRRICSEDVVRCIKKAIPLFHASPDKITPSELFTLINVYNQNLYGYEN